MSDKTLRQTLVFPIEKGNDPKVLLGKKVAQGKLGEGLIHGFGGNTEEGESPRAAAVRELEQESGLKASPDDLNYSGKLLVYEGGDLVREVLCYRLYKWEGNSERTDEMVPMWAPTNNLPLRKMFPDTPSWLGHVLKGGNLNKKLFYSAGMGEFTSSFTLPFTPEETY